MKDRLLYVDATRGVAILLVVTGHLMQFSGFPLDYPAFEFIYSFHMPLFFAISGYITQRVTEITSIRDLCIYVKKKFLSICLPLLFWTLIVYPLFFRENTAFDIYHIVRKLQNPNLWFLKTLFLILIVYGFHNFVANRVQIRNAKEVVAYMLTILLTFGIYKLNIDGNTILIQTVAFYIGVLLSKNQRIEGFCQKDSVVATCAVIFALLACKWQFYGEGLSYPIIKTIVSACSFVILLYLTKKINLNETSTLVKFGRCSIYIYILQFYFTRLFLPGDTLIYDMIGVRMTPFSVFFLTVILSFPLCAIGCWVKQILDYAPPMINLLLFGKRVN